MRVLLGNDSRGPELCRRAAVVAIVVVMCGLQPGCMMSRFTPKSGTASQKGIAKLPENEPQKSSVIPASKQTVEVPTERDVAESSDNWLDRLPKVPRIPLPRTD